MLIILNSDSNPVIPIIVGTTLILIIVMGILYNRKRKGPYPITYIYDDAGNLQFEIYQSDTTFSVINLSHNERVEQANFKNWDDLVSFIELEQRKWK